MTSGLTSKDIEEIKKYIESVRWQFAKTMPECPHEYTVKHWRPDKYADYEWFAKMIYKHGKDEMFGSKKYRYLYIDDRKYWVIGIIINRTQQTEGGRVNEKARGRLSGRVLS